ncbi:hypothetical protein ACSMXN_01535 [Jatrophihabitans sp. DSM 45814]
MTTDAGKPDNADDLAIEDLDAERVEHRSHLEPEEQKVGSDDPRRQAEIILEDSDERTEHPSAERSGGEDR